MDTLPEIITKKDLAAKELLKQVNLLLENEVDTLVENKLARDIPVLTRENVSQTITEQESYRDSDGNTRYRSVQRTYNFVYDNYMYGQKVSSITDASQCSITRGSEYRQGESYIVEANQGYDPQKASGNSALLARDINAGIVCSSNDATATKAYW